MQVSAKNAGRAGLLAVILVVGAAVAAAAMLPVQAGLVALGIRLQDAGTTGIALFAGLYVVAAMVFVPASALSLAAGLIFGPVGVVLAWLLMMLAATLSFGLSRALLAGPARRLIARRRLARAVADVIDEEGWRMVLLVRISGIVPFGLQNYVLGVTRIGTVPYLAATAVGVLPSILVYAGAGALGNAVATGAPAGALTAVLLTVAVAAGLALVVMAGRKVRARLRAA